MFAKLKGYLKKEFPLYMTVALLVAWSFALVYLNLVPTPYTVKLVDKNLIRQNTGLQIELIKRYASMDPDILHQFMVENLKFAVIIEEIICGESSQVAKDAVTKAASTGEKD